MYRLRGLPPGDYFVVAVDDVEQGEWFDPSYLEQIAREGAVSRSARGKRRRRICGSPRRIVNQMQTGEPQERREEREPEQPERAVQDRPAVHPDGHDVGNVLLAA